MISDGTVVRRFHDGIHRTSCVVSDLRGIFERNTVDFFDPEVVLQQVNRDLQRIYRNECRCHERLNGKTEGFKRISYTGLSG